MLNEGTKSLKIKLKEDKKNKNYKLFGVRQASIKELFKQFNALNNKIYLQTKKPSHGMKSW